MKNSKTITEVLDTDYHEYGMYTIENRAIPSVVDGFKPTQRKVAEMASRVWKRGDEKPLKVFQLTGKLAADLSYHHGEAGSSGSIIGMAQGFKNSAQILDGIGQFGSLRAPEAGAARYISVRLSEVFRKLYLDENLLEYKEEDGQTIEPKYFLPIIPTVLLNGTSGIAVGFATNILNRHPIELAEACLLELKGKSFQEPVPWLKEYSGKFSLIDTNKYEARGTWYQKDTSTIIIQELPPYMTFEKYESVLDSLVNNGTLSRWDDNSKKTPNYTLKFQRSVLKDLISTSKLDKTLKLVQTDTENLVCLDENGSLVKYDNASDIIKWFVKFRLTKYDLRKKITIGQLTDKMTMMKNKARFIKMVVDREIIIEKRQRKDIENELISFKFDKFDGGYSYLLNMPIHSLTIETKKSLDNDVEKILKEINELESTPASKMYEADIKSFISYMKTII